MIMGFCALQDALARGASLGEVPSDPLEVLRQQLTCPPTRSDFLACGRITTTEMSAATFGACKVPATHEVFHARFVDHAYPAHTHDAWTVFTIDEGSIAYDLERRHRGVEGSKVTLPPPHVVHDGRPLPPGTASACSTSGPRSSASTWSAGPSTSPTSSSPRSSEASRRCTGARLITRGSERTTARDGEHPDMAGTAHPNRGASFGHEV
jgi:hypothetical protein